MTGTSSVPPEVSPRMTGDGHPYLQLLRGAVEGEGSRIESASVAGDAVGDLEFPKASGVFAPVVYSGEGPVGVIGGVGGVASMFLGKAAGCSIGAGQLNFEFPTGRVGDIGSDSGVLDAEA